MCCSPKSRLRSGKDRSALPILIRSLQSIEREMGYQFADPFDQYGNNYLLTAGYPWDTLSSAGVATVLNTDFRFTPPGSLPGGCCSVTQGNWIRKNLGSFQGSTGSVQLFLNGSGVAAINSTGLNTQATGSPQITQVSIGNSNNQGSVIKYDDFMVYDP